MGLLDTWQEWKDRYDQTGKTDRGTLATAGGVQPTKGLRTGMAGYEAPANAYTGLVPDTKTRLGQITQKGTYDQAPKLPATDRLGRPYPVDAQGKIITPGTRATALQLKKQQADVPTNKVYQDAIMQGGSGANMPTDLNWWQKLSGMFNSKFDLEGAKASWTKKGGFEGLMANPAFTMGLAFMQSAAEGKSIGQGALDNVIKAGGISHTYKKIIEDRKQEPIQATAADIDEVKTLLDRVKLKEPNMWEKALGWVTGDEVTAKYDRAAEAVAIAYQVELQAAQAKNLDATGKPLVIDEDFKEKILMKVLKEKRVKQKDGWAIFGPLTSGTIQKESLLPKFNAQGGPVAKGEVSIVGEGGPEYFLPKESGKILSNDDSRIFAMLLAANPQLQNVSKTRSEKILRNRFPEYFE